MSENKLFELDGKVALVTGAGTGLGEGYAKLLAKAGCQVACADINTAAAEDTAAGVVGAGYKAKAFYVNVADLPSIQIAMSEIIKEYGRIDILVNNAGVESIAPYLDVTPEQYDNITAVNLRGVFFMAQAVARAMKETGGKIINIGSLGSYIGLKESSVYCSTKGGVVQLTKTMALELADYNIQVNAIAPGYFITPMTQPFYDDADHRAWIEGRIPLGRWGTVDDLAGPMIFLASSASDYVTGQVVVVDGGWLAS